MTRNILALTSLFLIIIALYLCGASWTDTTGRAAAGAVVAFVLAIVLGFVVEAKEAK